VWYIQVLPFPNLEVDGGATDGDDTAEVVVLAANGFLVASSTTSDTNDGDGGAGDTNEDVNALDNDAQKTEEEGSNRVTGAGDAVAALDVAGVALADSGSGGGSGDGDGLGGGWVASGHGGSKGSHGSDSNSGGETHSVSS